MNLYEEQRTLEEEASAAGYRRFEKRLRRAEEAGRSTEEGAGKKLVREALLMMATGISKVCEDAGGRGPVSPIVSWSNAIGHDVVAYLTIKAVLDAVLSPRSNSKTNYKAPVPLSVVTHAITQLLKDQLKMQIFKAKEPGLYSYKMSNFDTSNYAHRLRSMRATMNWAGVEDVDQAGPEPAPRLSVTGRDDSNHRSREARHAAIQDEGTQQ
jgi:hypothetical protein